jgi:ribosome-associated protein
MLEIAHTIINTLEEKKGEEILLIDINKMAAFTDYFIICTGTSDRMLDALVDSVVLSVNEKHKIKGRIEGKSHSGWMVIDYGSILVHLFSPDQRDYYKLEELWQDGKIILHVQ